MTAALAALPSRAAPPLAAAVRVFLVDDHPLLRDGVRQGLRADPGITVVGEAGAVDDAVARLPGCAADVVVSDIRMPERSGLDLVAILGRHQPTLRVLLLSMLDDAQLIQRALAAGAAGYVRKDAPGTQLIQAIRTVAEGGVHIDAPWAGRWSGGGMATRAPTRLTERESTILRLIAQGLGSRDIAEALGMSPRTVETHRLRMRRKLHLQTDVSLTDYVQAVPEILHG